MSDTTPRDVVPPRGLTLETLAALNAMVGKAVTFTEPGVVDLDVDGMPIAIGPPVETEAVMGTPILSLAELTRLGGTPDDYARLRFI